MARTTISTRDIRDQNVGRDDLDTVNTGKAVISKIVVGPGLKMTSTGVDPGTGDVTLDVNFSSAGMTRQYIHYQPVASDTWVCPHYLDAVPEVVILDSNGERVYTEIEYIDLNNVVIRFPSPFSGTAYFTVNQLTQLSHVQVVPTATWIIVHNLHRYPDVIIFDSTSGGPRIYADIVYDSEDQVTLYFTGSFAGVAYFI